MDMDLREGAGKSSDTFPVRLKWQVFPFFFNYYFLPRHSDRSERRGGKLLRRPLFCPHIIY